MLRSYNGFSGVERVRGWQVTRWLQMAGSLLHPTFCDLCGGMDRVSLHNEVYYTLTSAPALCSRCHRAIHNRERHWAKWQALVKLHSKSGAEWYCFVDREQPDVAALMRAKQGWAAADLLGSLRSSFDAGVMLPAGLMKHPAL